MRHFLTKAAAVCMMVCAGAAVAEISLNISVEGEIQPGVYGRIDFGHRPPPPVVYAQPIIVVEQHRVRPAPIYLHVPPGHAKNWKRHCRKYDACGVPVYFVRSREYDPEYHQHRERHEEHDDDHKHKRHKRD